MVVDVRCPAGCGLMGYKKNRNLKIRAWDPLGTVFYLAGLILIVNNIELGSGEFHSRAIFGMLLFIPGAYFSSLVTTDLSCNTCTGVILESKSIDKKFKGDLFGLSENKADYIRTALSSSTEESEYDCPDCRKKMTHIIVPIERERKAHEDPLLPDVVADLTSKLDSVKIDGCKDCDMLWFKNAKSEQKLSMDTAIIAKT